MTKQIIAGGVKIGGGAPVSVQSMTNTKTEDTAATIEQILRLEKAGCEIVRCAVPGMEAARAVEKIKENIHIPLVADIHFDYRLAVAAAEAGADKIRINPGNIGGDKNVRAVAEVCRKRGVPIRIGVNGGSLERELLAKYGGPTAEALAESALAHAALLNRYDFDDICISLKSSDPKITFEAYRLASEMMKWPLHVGVTEAGTSFTGLVRSAVAIGALLLEGIGDTIRVSLTAPPEEEVLAGIEILKAAGRRSGGAKLISCPSCGRCSIDLIGTAKEVERRLSGVDRDITVAVMGCEVNGPGEARLADYGLAGAKGGGIIFRHGEIAARVPGEKLVDALFDMINNDKGQQ